MVPLEIAARLFLACFLAWCICPRRSRSMARDRTLIVLSLIACCVAMAAEARGSRGEVLALAILLTATAIGFGRIARTRDTERALALLIEPVAAAALGVLAGQGLLIVSVALAGGLLTVDALLSVKPQPGRWSGEARTLRIRAQSLRGIVGRVESVLERAGLQPSHVAIDHNTRDKELTILIQLPSSFRQKAAELITALQDVEGVIQFVLE